MKVKELLDSPEKWIKEVLAVNARGESVQPDLGDACRWCLVGAIRQCYGFTPEGDRALVEVHEHLAARSGSGVLAWNDAPERTFAEVRQLILDLDI